jgi:hypothetical protein
MPLVVSSIPLLHLPVGGGAGVSRVRIAKAAQPLNLIQAPFERVVVAAFLASIATAIVCFGVQF